MLREKINKEEILFQLQTLHPNYKFNEIFGDIIIATKHKSLSVDVSQVDTFKQAVEKVTSRIFEFESEEQSINMDKQFIAEKQLDMPKTHGKPLDKPEQIMEPISDEPSNVTPDYYGAKCKCGSKLDPYVICDAYDNIQASAHHHALKKLIRAGEGHKPLKQDVQEVISTLNRWLEQLDV